VRESNRNDFYLQVWVKHIDTAMHRAKALSQNNTSTEGAQAHHKRIQKNTTHQLKARKRTTSGFKRTLHIN